jgi:hypothetical protein
MKNIISCEIGGFFSKNQCERIKEIMQGKTFYNFNIQYGGWGGNNTLLVSSEIEGYTSKELKEMFIYACLTELARVTD